MLSVAVSAERKLAERLLSSIGPKSDSLAIIRRCAEVTPSFNASLDASAYLTATLTAIVNGHKQSRFLASVGTGVLTSALASDFAGPKARVVCPTIISCGVYPPSYRAALNDQSVTVTTCGRICYKRKKINLSLVFAGQAVGIKQVEDHIWLASFMDYDLGYFDDETCRLEPLPNPFGPKVLLMSQE